MPSTQKRFRRPPHTSQETRLPRDLQSINQSSQYQQQSTQDQFRDFLELEPPVVARSTSTVFNFRRTEKPADDFYMNEFQRATQADLNLHPDCHQKSFYQTTHKFKYFRKVNTLQNEGVPQKGTNRYMETAPQGIREFYGGNKQYQKILGEYDGVNNTLDEVQQRVTCYRYELGNLLVQAKAQFRLVLEKVMEENIKVHKKLAEQKERESTLKAGLVAEAEKEKKKLEDYIAQLKSLQNVRETELSLCKLNSQSKKEEILLLHELIKKNRVQQIQHLSSLQDLDGTDKEDIGAGLVATISGLNKTIVELEDGNMEKDELFRTMENLLRQMLASKKKSVATQLDEVELEQSQKQMFQYREVIEKENNDIILLKAEGKEHHHQEDVDRMSKVSGENWNLTQTLLVFLENSVKNGDTSRVLPYSYFKNIIYEIYRFRLSLAEELASNLLDHYIVMDEFICIYFLETYKLRRLAEIKLLEFLVSLKYYSKLWPRAAIFSYLIQVSQYQVFSSNDNSFDYSFDIYVQQFFLHMFSVFDKERGYMKEHQEGYMLLDKKRLDDVARDIMLHQNDAGKKKLASKMMRLLKKIEIKPKHDWEGVDIDKMMEYALEDFLEFRKQNFKKIARKFQQVHEKVHGIFSVEDMGEVFKLLKDQKSPLEHLKFPGYFQVLRVFMHSLTSGTNKYTVNNRDFQRSLQKFGFDSPFPFCHVRGMQVESRPEGSRQVLGGMVNSSSTLKLKESTLQVVDQQESLEDTDTGHNKIMVDFGSHMLSSHFSILRELKQYVQQFRQSVTNEQDQEIVWKHFDNILTVLDNGCSFLSYPLRNKK